jgi:hypothetical protein
LGPSKDECLEEREDKETGTAICKHNKLWEIFVDQVFNTPCTGAPSEAPSGVYSVRLFAGDLASSRNVGIAKRRECLNSPLGHKY